MAQAVRRLQAVEPCLLIGICRAQAAALNARYRVPVEGCAQG